MVPITMKQDVMAHSVYACTYRCLAHAIYAIFFPPTLAIVQLYLLCPCHPEAVLVFFYASVLDCILFVRTFRMIFDCGLPKSFRHSRYEEIIACTAMERTGKTADSQEPI